MTRELWLQLRWALPIWLIGLLTNWWPDNRFAIKIRGIMARPFIRKCGCNFALGAQVTLLNTHNLEIGKDVYIARGAWLNCMAGLTLEDEVVISPYVVISTVQHVFKNGSVRHGGSIGRPVRIKRGTWLAAHATVKCGVTIGAGNLVGANAAVVSDTPDHVIVGGVPAKTIRPNADGDADFHTRRELETTGRDD